MDTAAVASKHWLSRALARYLGIYLVYLACLSRAVVLYEYSPRRVLAMILLVIYGLLLVSEPWLTRRWRRYPWVYLLVQLGLVTVVLRIPPSPDMVAMLFVPLSLQAVLFFRRRVGFIWIGAFLLAVADPVIGSFSLLPGLAMLGLYAGLYFLMGTYAHLIQRAEAARQENQRLIGELQGAQRQLQEYADQVEAFAAAQERGRMARELHDSATQTIFSMNLAVQAASMLVGPDPTQAARQLDRLLELGRSAAGEIQVLASQLQPRAAAAEDLPAALRRLAAEREAQDSLRVEVQVTGQRDLSEAIAAGLYRITQEAFNNVAKHAGTREAAVRLHLDGERACLEIEDHGAGFDPASISRQGGHMGLASMAERAREIGWALSIDSHPGQGTRVHVEEQ